MPGPTRPPRSRARRIVRRTLLIIGGLFAALLALGIVGLVVVDPEAAQAARDAARTSTPAPTTTPAAPPAPMAAPAPAPAPAPVPVPVPVPQPPPPSPPPAPVADTVVVTRVIDGDTFEAGPRTIRVLGIDSCEAGTDEGPAATGQARRLLLGVPVTLTPEPGVGVDRYGRELRYVDVPAGDFATAMVAAPHTAVYEGRNDASARRVADLRAADPDGRTCDRPDPVPAPAPVPDPDVDRPYVYTPPEVDAPRTRAPSGSSGRVGRDGDGDGLCNESTVPVPC